MLRVWIPIYCTKWKSDYLKKYTQEEEYKLVKRLYIKLLNNIHDQWLYRDVVVYEKV